VAEDHKGLLESLEFQGLIPVVSDWFVDAKRWRKE
jgi:hypothetical protein